MRLTEWQFNFLKKFYLNDGYTEEEIPDMIMEAKIIQNENHLILHWEDTDAIDVFLKEDGYLSLC